MSKRVNLFKTPEDNIENWLKKSIYTSLQKGYSIETISSVLQVSPELVKEIQLELDLSKILNRH